MSHKPIEPKHKPQTIIRAAVELSFGDGGTGSICNCLITKINNGI